MDKKNIQKNASGIKRLPRAIMCSLKGYQTAWRFESGFRQYTVISVLLLPCSVFIALSSLHSSILSLSLLLLLFAELVNSAIEAACDAISKEYNEYIARAKDVGSATVFTSLIIVFLVWFHALYQYIKQFS